MKKLILLLFAVLVFSSVTNNCMAQNAKPATQKPASNTSNNNGSTQGKTFTLTKEGVGCLKKNMLVSTIPASYPGLYDRFEKKLIEDDFNGNYIEYSFYYGKEKVVESKDLEDGKLYFFEVFSPKISISGGVYPGMPIKELLKINGVKGEYGDGISLSFNGFTINFGSFSSLTAHGEKIFNDAYSRGTDVKLSNACFKDGAKVVSIFNY